MVEEPSMLPQQTRGYLSCTLSRSPMQSLVLFLLGRCVVGYHPHDHSCSWVRNAGVWHLLRHAADGYLKSGVPWRPPSDRIRKLMDDMGNCPLGIHTLKLLDLDVSGGAASMTYAESRVFGFGVYRYFSLFDVLLSGWPTFALVHRACRVRAAVTRPNVDFCPSRNRRSVRGVLAYAMNTVAAINRWVSGPNVSATATQEGRGIAIDVIRTVADRIQIVQDLWKHIWIVLDPTAATVSKFLGFSDERPCCAMWEELAILQERFRGTYELRCASGNLRTDGAVCPACRLMSQSVFFEEAAFVHHALKALRGAADAVPRQALNHAWSPAMRLLDSASAAMRDRVSSLLSSERSSNLVTPFYCGPGGPSGPEFADSLRFDGAVLPKPPYTFTTKIRRYLRTMSAGASLSGKGQYQTFISWGGLTVGENAEIVGVELRLTPAGGVEYGELSEFGWHYVQAPPEAYILDESWHTIAVMSTAPASEGRPATSRVIRLCVDGRLCGKADFPAPIPVGLAPGARSARLSASWRDYVFLGEVADLRIYHENMSLDALRFAATTEVPCTSIPSSRLGETGGGPAEAHSQANARDKATAVPPLLSADTAIYPTSAAAAKRPPRHAAALVTIMTCEDARFGLDTSNRAADSGNDAQASWATSIEEEERAEARAVLLTYVDVVRTLAYSARRAGVVEPFIVLISLHQGGSVPPDTLAVLRAMETAELIRVLIVPPAPLHIKPRSWGKLQLWKLQEYEVVLYLDADTLVLRDVGELFANMAATEGAPVFAAAITKSMSALNAGVMLLKPNEEVYKAMLESMLGRRYWKGTSRWSGQPWNVEPEEAFPAEAQSSSVKAGASQPITEQRSVLEDQDYLNEFVASSFSYLGQLGLRPRSAPGREAGDPSSTNIFLPVCQRNEQQHEPYHKVLSTMPTTEQTTRLSFCSLPLAYNFCVSLTCFQQYYDAALNRRGVLWEALHEQLFHIAAAADTATVFGHAQNVQEDGTMSAAASAAASAPVTPLATAPVASSIGGDSVQNVINTSALTTADGSPAFGTKPAVTTAMLGAKILHWPGQLQKPWQRCVPAARTQFDDAWWEVYSATCSENLLGAPCSIRC
eukprot:TRINITY_DN16555_c0_g1_i1.p1 TRINITY_DN16555_c0_g1~~TRINITY_DN16555_c0_g1_i1.p1  ORF type:complete len:1101 (-),score=129.22 TRINITY_DN16555_c0_g1_i1:146-3448(-)